MLFIRSSQIQADISNEPKRSSLASNVAKLLSSSQMTLLKLYMP